MTDPRKDSWLSTRRVWRQRIGISAVMASSGLLAWGGDALPVEVRIVLWAVWTLAAALLARGGWLLLFGPLLLYDWTAMARQRRFFLVRLVYAVGLLVLLTSLYAAWAWNLPGDKRPTGADMTRFADSFFLTFMAAEFAVVLLLTPLYLAGAIAEEKDRGTWQFLLTTDLSNREIVLGKLLARLATLTLLLLVGLPVLSFTQFFGGVDPGLVLGGFAALALTLASLSALSILHSV